MRVRLHPRSGVRSVRLPDGTVLTHGVTVDVPRAVFATHARRRNGRPLLEDLTPVRSRKPRPKPTPKPQPEQAADNAADPSQEDN